MSRPRPGLPRVPALLLGLLLLLLPAPAGRAQEDGRGGPGGGASPAAGERKDPAWYLRQAREAIEREFYESAVNLLREGQAAWPEEPELRVLLGDLFYDRQLHRPALEEYLQARRLGTRDYFTLNQIARTYGRLNEEAAAIGQLQELLELYPDSPEAIDDLGWMYFKTHRLEEGRKLLEAALHRYAGDRSLLMTLGTICSGLYDYGSSRRLYLQAIESADREGDGYFASVALYNLSLLERNFRHFQEALNDTEEAGRRADRSPGHLARGELFQGRLEYRAALQEYQRAFQLDGSPLARVNLAALHQRFGDLETARRTAEEILRSGELSWMYYYGIDRDRHFQDLHEILADTYGGLAVQERSRPTASAFERLAAGLQSLRFRLISWHHRRRFRMYSVRVGRSYLAEGNELDGAFALYQANERYPRIALKYLLRARRLETRLIPGAAAAYDLEEGKLRRSRPLLERALLGFDPSWEREKTAEAFQRLIPLLPRRSPQRREALNRLYGLNPGALRQGGLGLPLAVRFAGEEGGRAPPAGGSGQAVAAGGAGPGAGGRGTAALRGADPRIARIRRLLARAGCELQAPVPAAETLPADGLRPADGFRYELEIRLPRPAAGAAMAAPAAGPLPLARFRLIDRSGVGRSVEGTVFGPAGAGGPAQGQARQAREIVAGILERIYRPD